MKSKQLWMVLAAAIAAAIPAVKASAAGQTTAAATYVNENGTDPAPLNLRELQGKVEGLGGEAMPRVQLALFREGDHSLLATTVSGIDGKFKFDKVEKGLYRIVARVEGLCPANVPVKMESGLLAKRKMTITMRPKGLDTCSYGVAK